MHIQIERKHIALNVFDSTEVEVHWVPSELDNPFTNKRLRAWYESEAERQFSNVSGLGFCTPTAEFNTCICCCISMSISCMRVWG